jgi:hypothetical protein
MKVKALILFLALAGLLPLVAQAQVNYAVSGNTAYVAYSPGAFGNVVISNIYNGYPVTSIGSGAFEDCGSLKSVTIPNSVTNISDFAFYGCGLTNVVIPDSVTNIGQQAFYDCTSLTNVIIGTNVVSIGHDAFVYCNLTSVIIPGSVANLGSGAFAYCNLTNITFLGNAPTLEENDAFYGDPATAVYYYNGTSGWSFDFGGLPTVELGIPPLTYVTESGIVTITGYTGTNGTVTIGGTINGYPIRSIRLQAFYNCINLTNVVIDNGVTNIGNEAFYQCVNLTSVTISNSATSIGAGAFEFCTSLTNVIIGNGVENIGDAAFKYCTNLTSVIIPNSVTSIGNYAFQVDTSLTNIIIGNGVENIGDAAFAACAVNLAVTFLGNTPALGNNIFGIPSLSPHPPPFYVMVYYYYGTSGWGATYGGLSTVELAWTPQIVGGVSIQSNNFGFTIIGTNGMSAVVEASTNLVDWQPVWTNTLSGASATFTDSQWKNYPTRFYRARQMKHT